MKSVQVNIRLTSEQHHELKTKSAMAGMTMSQLIIKLVAESDPDILLNETIQKLKSLRLRKSK